MRSNMQIALAWMALAVHESHAEQEIMLPHSPEESDWEGIGVQNMEFLLI